MVDKKERFKQDILKVIEIQSKIVKESKYFTEKQKEAIINLSSHSINLIQNQSCNLSQLKSILSDLLVLWQESIGVDTELFWIEIQKEEIDIIREDQLLFALDKGRFKRVDMGFHARSSWQTIREFESIHNRFSKQEIEELDILIESGEKTRLEFLMKYLKKKEIPKTQYLKFGECIAYFAYCSLFDKYFSKEQIKDLYHIWNNFNYIKKASSN